VLSRALTEIDGEFDLALQVFGWVEGQPRPYALYVDQTRLMAERGWPDWIPFTRSERTELLALERTMYERAYHVFVMGKPARQSLVADYGINPSRITVVGGGLNFETPPELGKPSPDPTILFVGKDFERKGGDRLVRAFERVRIEVPQATLHLVGVSGRFDVPGVVVHGKIFNREHLAELYRAARVFCLPSRYEPYGLVLLEAMAHGIPCVGSACESIPEILDDGRAGLVVADSGPAPLADALLELLTDYDRALELGAAGRGWVERSLTWDHVVARMVPVVVSARTN
jgi:glycosyltransferase involved in cell wall biosynthesis